MYSSTQVHLFSAHLPATWCISLGTGCKLLGGRQTDEKRQSQPSRSPGPGKAWTSERILTQLQRSGLPHTWGRLGVGVQSGRRGNEDGVGPGSRRRASCGLRKHMVTRNQTCENSPRIKGNFHIENQRKSLLKIRATMDRRERERGWREAYMDVLSILARTGQAGLLCDSEDPEVAG